MENEKYVYQRNIKVIENFYNSDYYRDLKEKSLIKAIINAIYIDPDNRDEHVYKDLSERLKLKHKDGKFELYNNVGIKLSADAVCGWKQLYDLRKGSKEWLHDYEEMRTCTAAYLVWPRHNKPTINTLRYSIFRDRVDYTLFDISKFFGCKKIFDGNKNQEQFEDNVKDNCKLNEAYLNKLGTYNWLMTFNGFEDFIEKMCLIRFVNSKYKVLNLEDHSVISEYNSFYSFNETYLKNLKNIIMNNNDSKNKSTF
ncbi:hypothetical protein [Desulfitobacterium metallireducens]|uniref:Uncharacterized protein n=1 Tax=Desulfitobacterium metallireducens DSM 15288 TaxID=871968 RepID=W0EGJ6_9FIRM|nr:hypothetical protein [Desulfitobacterium metallireducens]AHF08643.1 hypothetical protein DESME_11700 [Desulfitobacterium metallireducens DSM 15288]